MTQRDLNHAVARATGESADTIAQMGFQIHAPEDLSLGDADDLGPNAIDWDGLGDDASPSPLREFFRAPACA